MLSSQNPVIPDEIVMHSSCVVRPVPRFSGTSPANQIMDVNFPQNRPARPWCARRKRVALAGHGRDRGSVVGTRPPSRPHRHGFVAHTRESRIDRRDLLQILGIRSPVIERVRGGSAPHGPADPAGPLSVGDSRSLGQSACPRVATPVRAWGGSDPCGRTLQRQGSPALGRAGVGRRCGHVGVRIRQGPPSCSVFRLPWTTTGGWCQQFLGRVVFGSEARAHGRRPPVAPRALRPGFSHSPPSGHEPGPGRHRATRF